MHCIRAELERHRLRHVHVAQGADRRQEAFFGILGIHARLDRVAVDAEFMLFLRQRLAKGDAQLPFDQI